MGEEVSKRTITVLVILTVLISILGTFSVWTAFNQYEIRDSHIEPSRGSNQGHVALEIKAPKEPKVSSATGMVSLSINTRGA